MTFAGTVALSNCSGSVVRTPDAAPTDPALVLSNGALPGVRLPGPRRGRRRPAVLPDVLTLLNASGRGVGTLRAEIALRHHGRHRSLYELTSTWTGADRVDEVAASAALELETAHPRRAGTAVRGRLRLLEAHLQL
ncbi:serine protease [Streptomyces badius]